MSFDRRSSTGFAARSASPPWAAAWVCVAAFAWVSTAMLGCGIETSGNDPSSDAGSDAGTNDASTLDAPPCDAPDVDIDGSCGPSVPVCEGDVVDSASECLQDDAFCEPLEGGRWCTGPRASHCPPGSRPLANDAPCPPNETCFQHSESRRCGRRLFTVDDCEMAGGEALADPGDGSLHEAGCPDGYPALGAIDGVASGWDEGGLCCAKVLRSECLPHDATFTGGCEPAPRYHWNGVFCEPRTGCECTGEDCDAGFASGEDCESAHVGCGGVFRSCGGLGGVVRCAEDEYCAYQPGQICGALDAPAICLPRPTACDQVYAPVCSCDGQTYGNACEAAAAGKGIQSFGECP